MNPLRKCYSVGEKTRCFWVPWLILCGIGDQTQGLALFQLGQVLYQVSHIPGFLFPPRPLRTEELRWALLRDERVSWLGEKPPQAAT